MSESVDDLEHEERAIYWIALAAAIPVLAGVLLGAGVFDAGTTISLGLAILAGLGLASLRHRRAAAPRARVVQRRRAPVPR